MDNGKKKPVGIYFEFAVLSMVGMQLAVSIFIGFGFGYWLDTKMGTKPLLMLLFGLFGIIAGFLNVYRIVKAKVKED